MSNQSVSSANGWRNVSKASPCRICGKNDWCRRTDDGRREDCYRQCGPGGREKTDKAGCRFYRHGGRDFGGPRGGGGGGHNPSPTEGDAPEDHPDDESDDDDRIRYQYTRADPDTLHAVYTELLKLLPLSDAHRAHLQFERGLTNKEIEEDGYGTLPSDKKAVGAAIKALRAKYKDEVLVTVPGIYGEYVLVTNKETGKDESRMKMVLGGKPGIMLPRRDVEGRIHGIEIRDDNENTERRYLPFTSRTCFGAKFVPSSHVPVHPRGMQTQIVGTTEGFFKANIAFRKTGILYVALSSGARSTEAIPVLAELGAEGVRITPDADIRSKGSIASARAAELCSYLALGYEVWVAKWEPAYGKGIDDVILGGKLVGNSIETIEKLPGHGDDVLSLHGREALRFVQECLKSSGAPPYEPLEARITLSGLVDRVKKQPAEAFRPDVLRAILILDQASVEYQALMSALEEALPERKWKQFQQALGKDARQRAAEGKAKRLEEIKASGQVLLTRGDQVELRDVLLERYTPVGSRGFDHELLAFDCGALHLFEKGVWTPLTEEQLVTDVTTYAGSPIGTKMEPLRISNPFARGAVALLQAHRNKPDFFKEAPLGIAFTNGFLQVNVEARTVDLVPLKKEHRVRVRYDFDYVPGRIPKRTIEVIRRVFAGSEVDAKTECLREVAGAGFLGVAAKFAKALIFKGEGQDGKSVVLQLIENAAPKGSVCHVSPEDMSDEYSRAHLDGRLLNLVYDLPERKLLATGELKAVITGDAMKARNPYGKPFDSSPRAANFFALNKLPPTDDTTRGFRRRFVILLCDQQIDDTEKNEFLADELRAEIPDFVCWLIDGAIARLKRNYYTTPASSEAEVTAWLKEADPTAIYIEEDLVTLDEEAKKDGKNWTKASILYRVYRDWATANGHLLVSSTTFGKKVRAHFKLTTPKTVEEGKREDGIYYPIRVASIVRQEAKVAEAVTHLDRQMNEAAGEAMSVPSEIDRDEERAEDAWTRELGHRIADTEEDVVLN